MSDRQPAEIAAAAVAGGVSKVEVGAGKLFVGSFLAGAYIAFGGLVAIAVSLRPRPEDVGDAADPVHGLRVRPRPGARRRRRVAPAHRQHDARADRRPGGRVSGRAVVHQPDVVTSATWSGSLFVAYFLAVKTGVIGRPSAGRQPAALTFTRLIAIADGKASPRATGRSSCARSAATGWSASRSGWRSGRGHRRQDPRHLLPDHRVRRARLRPRRRQHVLPAGRDLRRACPTSAGSTPCGTGCSPSSVTSSAPGLRVDVVLVHVPARRGGPCRHGGRLTVRGGHPLTLTARPHGRWPPPGSAADPRQHRLGDVLRRRLRQPVAAVQLDEAVLPPHVACGGLGAAGRARSRAAPRRTSRARRPGRPRGGPRTAGPGTSSAPRSARRAAASPCCSARRTRPAARCRERAAQAPATSSSGARGSWNSPMYHDRTACPPVTSEAAIAPGCGVDRTVSELTRSGCQAPTAHACAPPQSWPTRCACARPAASSSATTSAAVSSVR